MTVFVDTSALYSLVNVADTHHDHARLIFDRLINETIVTHNYVEVEAVSLVHARHGIGPLPRLREILDPIERIWIEDDLHEDALERLSLSGRRGPSLVDCVSFEVMERYGINEAFAFDDHFAAAGFRTLDA